MRHGIAIVAVGTVCGAMALGLAQQGKETILGQYETSLVGRSQSQRHNVTLSMKAIQGKVIQPGESFSFNKAVGSWSRDKGFKKAPVSFNGSLLDAWGGGVCQTSTTLYNAALLAGLEPVERHAHRFAPQYVPPGRDAAVAYPNLDLIVRNPYDKPVTISAAITAGKIRVEVRGVLPDPQVRLESRVIKAIQPRTATLGDGRSAWVRSPGKPGYEVEVIRTMKGERERVSRNTYPVMHRVVQWVDDVK